jgi:hypothetical protein
MTSRYLLCTDLDRTLIPNGSQPESPLARELFQRLVGRPELQLAYVSGRSLALVQEAINSWQLPCPDFILGDVGTSIYATPTALEAVTEEKQPTMDSEIDSKSLEWHRWESWDREIAPDWKGRSGQDIAGLLNDIPELELQEAHKQSTFKSSYYVALGIDAEELLDTLRSILSRADIAASLIWSVDEAAVTGLLDILPACATKKHAIDFLIKNQQFELADTVFAGDSGNDLPVLTSPIHSVLVANASPAVREAALQEAALSGHSDALYIARGGYLNMNGNYGAGIIEGFVHYIPEAEQWLQEESR